MTAVQTLAPEHRSELCAWASAAMPNRSRRIQCEYRREPTDDPLVSVERIEFATSGDFDCTRLSSLRADATVGELEACILETAMWPELLREWERTTEAARETRCDSGLCADGSTADCRLLRPACWEELSR